MFWKISHICIGGLLLAGSAIAETQPAAAADDAGLENDPCLTDVLCRARFNRGRKLSKEDNYEEALAAYESAYQRRPVAWLLINMGRTLHKLGRPNEAIERYKQYLEAEPNGPAERKQRAEKFFKEAQDEAAQQKTKQATPPPTLRVPDDAPAVEPDPLPLLSPKPEPSLSTLPNVAPGMPAPVTNNTTQRLGWLWAGIAGGGALLLAGAVTGGIALSAASAGRGIAYVGDPSQEALDAQSRAHSLGMASDVLLAAGAATVGAVTVAYLVKRSRTPRDQRNVARTAGLSPSGASIRLVVSY